MRERRVYALLGVLASLACGVPLEHARAWEGIHKGTFLLGYTEYRGEIDGTDDGYIVMSYRVPDTVPTREAVREVKRQVMSKHPCYAALQESATDLVLHCPGGLPRYGFMWDEEYRVLLQPRARRIFVLILDSVGRQRYHEFTKALEPFRES